MDVGRQTIDNRPAAIGILMLDTRFPRILGDVGNPATFPFPVRYHRVATAFAERVVRQDARDLLPVFIEGAKTLEREGARAVTTSCGFLARFQDDLASAVTVPVFTSALMLVPLVHRMLAPGRRVGILTFDASALTERELAGVGITSDIAVAIAGMEPESEFQRAILEDRTTMDVESVCREHVEVAARLCAAHTDVGAIVLECTNMPPYRADIQRVTGLPVFDIVQLVTLAHQAITHPIAGTAPSVGPDLPRRIHP